MAQVSLDGLNIIPALDRGNGVTVTKVMHPGIRPANQSHQPLIVVIDGIRREMFSQLIGKHKAAVLPGRACPKTPLRLLAPLAPQQVHHKISGRDASPSIILERHKTVSSLSGFIFGPLELSVDQ